MPPRIRTRASKALKENIDVTENKKTVKTTSKGPRKALADKTNSASDDGSLEIPSKAKKTNTKTLKTGSNKNGEKKIETKQKETVSQPKGNVPSSKEVRPRRDRRLPNRFVENTILNNLSNSKENANVTLSSPLTNPKDNTPVKIDSLSKNEAEPSPFKTPGKADSSLLANRPRRICRLPSRFDDHSVSPNKYIPIQPANASTPIQLSKAKPLVILTDKDKVDINVIKPTDKKQETVARPTRSAKNTQQKESNEKTTDKSSPDTNNNPKTRSTRRKAANTQASNEKVSPPKKVTKPQQPTNQKESPLNKSPTKTNQSTVNKDASPIRKFLTPMAKFPILPSKTISSKKQLSPKKSNNNKASQNVSFKLLGSKKNGEQNNDNENGNDGDIYEFTFDPEEEPKPQKKKRKKVTTAKKPATVVPTKQKKVIYKSSYDQNISKALAALKNAVKPSKTADLPQITEIAEENHVENHVANNKNQVQTNNVTKENNPLNDTGKASVHGFNYPSIRVEDIAADIEPSMDHVDHHHDDLNYSPVNSPRPVNGLSTPNASVNHRATPERSVHNNDPLNLAEELSFFDEQPVASSSMNMSVRHPLASPWRVEFGNLPIKWQVNAYVKPNMTPAVDTSFINPDDSMKKKHVYTNLLTEANDEPETVETTPNLKQPSIISFIKEMAEKSARKKRGRSKSMSPTRAVLKENVNRNENVNKRSTRRNVVDNEASEHSNNTSEEVTSGNDTSHDKENSKEERRPKKRKNNENICDLPAKSPRKQKDKDHTFFGFDDSENQDENVSPVKVPPKGRALRTRSKAVLKEINGPLRADLPVAAKTKIATSSEAVNRVYEELKSAADAPVFPEKDVQTNETNVEESVMNDDAQSVHLFEDIEVVHHLKPQRKSYGKAKKVTFRQRSNSDSDTQVPAVVDPNDSTDYDDLGDLTFEIANEEQKKKVNKKKKPKRLMSKKEEKEAEEWAANFNSMCEDIEEFPLLVE